MCLRLARALNEEYCAFFGASFFEQDESNANSEAEDQADRAVEDKEMKEMQGT